MTQSSISQSLKHQLNSMIHSLGAHSKDYTKHPKDFTRNRKLTFETTLKLLLSMGSQNLSNELLNFFNFALETPTASAFTQARNKIKIDAFKALFYGTQSRETSNKTFKGFHLYAHDGSVLALPYLPSEPDTHQIAGKERNNISLIHLNALYDLLNKNYVNMDFQTKKTLDERTSLCEMLSKAPLPKNSILLADRGYESFNVFEHLKQVEQHFVIRVKDIQSNGFLHHLPLPKSECFDRVIQFNLTRRQTKASKNDPNFCFLSNNSKFDFLPIGSKESYPMALRVVRIQLSLNHYECLVTNLDSFHFSSEDLKEVYHMRWGIETSFRELKYALGLVHLHSKKPSFILQEIYARLIMYNFSMRIAISIELEKKERKHLYQINFTQAIAICRQYFRSNHFLVEPLLRRYLLPVRPNRHDKRKFGFKGSPSFLYRVA